MQKAVELEVGGQVLRGMEHLPEASSGGSNGQKVPAVVIFHGFTGHKAGAHRMYVKMSRMLEAMGYASFRFDFSGSGESDGDFQDMTLSREIEEGKAILDFVRSHPAIDEGRVSLFGHSMGGVVASTIAASRQNEVHRLLLMCSAGNMSKAIAEVAKQVEEAHQGRPLPSVYDNEGDLVGMSFANEISHMDLFEMAKGFTKPVLLLHGTKDEAVPLETSQRYRDVCYGGQATIRLVEEADHSFNSHRWEAAALAEIREFLAASG